MLLVGNQNDITLTLILNLKFKAKPISVCMYLQNKAVLIKVKVTGFQPLAKICEGYRRIILKRNRLISSLRLY